ncbi:hypothetical protein [Devosia chinhatensis]|uniref:Uncharacterized protein n=1 Tax=Devosia chinhatensis TaxID=429727 RepID=A0A0F5FFR4_9HYPH|nr:hypothetical protein [Devosia chinhatensis]KKB07440.1 hypothetical protein VE26_11770 [Devosia chinhatensis]
MRKILAATLLTLTLSMPSVMAQPIPAQEITLDAEAEARIRRAVEALVPEYNRRLARDGETSANDWIRQKAFELGQREAELMKQRLGRN